MPSFTHARRVLVHALFLLPVSFFAAAAQNEPRQVPAGDPRAMVQTAVDAELEADRDDHTAFIYHDHDVTPDHDIDSLVVETPKGILKRKLLDHGRPLTPEQRAADEAGIQELLSSSSLQEKQMKDSRHDDAQAEVLLRLLPVAFIWNVAGQKGNLLTLAFRPDPAYHPPSIEAKVLSTMQGEIVVSLPQHRIATIKGSLSQDVNIGFGLLGRLRQGGAFQVERREVEPHHWQVTESHVHIIGHALFFKSIGDQELEVKTDFRQSNAETLQQAEQILKESH